MEGKLAQRGSPDGGNGLAAPDKRGGAKQPALRALEIARERGAGFKEEEPLIIIPGTHAHILKDNEAISARGWRGWKRVIQVARVLGLLSLYLFLDSYDIRATFNERFSRRKREEARVRGHVARFQEWTREIDR